jgi:tRNA pseudouridine38-40 synthase
MRLAAQAFVGMRDFRAFTPDVTPEEEMEMRSTLVLVERLELVEDGDLILIGIEGSHFLWKMVRRIVGVLVEVGRGGLDTAAVATLLAGESASPARLTAPPSGLFLEKVYYKGDPQDVPPRAATPLS